MTDATKKAWYFSFGQYHTHRYDGMTLDCDIIVRIFADDSGQAREIMFNKFGDKWGFQYDVEPNLAHFPRGTVTIGEQS